MYVFSTSDTKHLGLSGGAAGAMETLLRTHDKPCKVECDRVVVHILLSLAPLADFYSLNPNEQEASVKAGPSLQPGLTHEVLVSKGGIFTFYRNGVQLASVPSPRAVTDCEGDVVLMGDPSVALASVSFYARALEPNEVAEMYVGGQPLSELATASVLPQVEIQSEDQIMQTVCACNQSMCFIVIDAATVVQPFHAVRTARNRLHGED